MLALLAASVLHSASALGAAPEPYEPLNGGAFVGSRQPSSPDPLVSYVWPPGGAYNVSALQIFVVGAVSVGATPLSPSGSFQNASSCVNATGGAAGACALRVTGPGTVVIDFGVELAGWLEFDSPDLVDTSMVELGISEYATTGKGGWVGGYKVGPPTQHGTTFRLETNDELYEGVRYAMITLNSAPAASFTITAIRCVAQVRPLTYTGAFHSAGDPLLERVWWTGAYTIRVLLLSDYMGSVLMDRGDRISWTGDAFVSQGTFYSFASDYSIPLQNLLLTSCDDCCQGIASYCLLFVLSACEYAAQTNDTATFLSLVPIMERKLEEAYARYNSDFPMHSMRFWGWDDRTGSGFANDTTPETIWQYKFLAIRCWSTFAAAAAPFNATLAQHFAAYATAAIAGLRSSPSQPWWGGLGLHAGADAINANFTTPAETAGIVESVMSDIVRLPSLSHFNQYFILTATGVAGQLDGGVEQVRKFWGADILLGATTFFEVGHPELADILPPGPTALPGEQNGWTLLCADWSTGATQWLSRWILGVRPLAWGFRRALVAPHISHTMTGVSGVQPTPHGSINVSVSADGVVIVESPSGVHEVVLQLSEIILARMGAGVNGAALEDVDIVVDDGGGSGALRSVVAAPTDTPLVDETRPGSPRARALVVSLAGGRRWALRVRDSLRRRSSSAPLHASSASPYPPPVYPGRFVSADVTTRGDWTTKYGSEGFALFSYDKSPASAGDHFCGGAGEGATLTMSCDDPGATLNVSFASYGTAPLGLCPNLGVPSCDAPASLEVVRAACDGAHSCSVTANVDTFHVDPCVGTVKQLAVVAECSSGGGSSSGIVPSISDRVQLPSWVQSVTVLNSTVGFLGTGGQWVNQSSDPRALRDPDDATRRALGATQPCGGPTSPVDIVLKNRSAPYSLSLYFVDFGAAPVCTSLDGTNRTQELLLMSGYPALNPLAPRMLLDDFSGGTWLTFEVAGDVRVRISTITGDQAVLSAIAFDEVTKVQ